MPHESLLKLVHATSSTSLRPLVALRYSYLRVRKLDDAYSFSNWQRFSWIPVTA